MTDALAVDAGLRRGAFALSAQFTAPRDGVTALFGASGAGKSLLLSAIAGLSRIERGRIAFGARVLDDVNAGLHVAAHRRGVGLVFQDARLFPHLSVRGNLAFAATRAPAPPDIDATARAFDIAPLLDRSPRHLSGGERSRVALARAALSAPDLLLLDEPFAALDGARRSEFLATLREMHARLALPMVVVTHQIDDAAALADHLVGLSAGAVTVSGAFAATALTPAFQALLDPRDVGAALAPSAFAHAPRTPAASVWVRADHVLLASEAPRGLSARNVWAGRVVEVKHETSGRRLVHVETTAGGVLSRITTEAERELGVAPGAPVWAIVKAHAIPGSET